MWIILMSLLLPAQPVQPDQVAMQGEWGCRLNIRDGQKQPEEVTETLFRDTKDDLVTISLYDRPLQSMKMKLNDKTNPKQIDLTMLDGPAKDKVALGIYELKEGELKLCTAQPGQPRPTALESKEGSGHSLTVWKQNKK